jgi:hypothetical protein
MIGRLVAALAVLTVASALAVLSAWLALRFAPGSQVVKVGPWGMSAAAASASADMDTRALHDRKSHNVFKLDDRDITGGRVELSLAPAAARARLKARQPERKNGSAGAEQKDRPEQARSAPPSAFAKASAGQGFGVLGSRKADIPPKPWRRRMAEADLRDARCPHPPVAP